MAVDLAITPDQHWDVSTADLARAAKAAGFAGLGIAVDRIDADAAAVYSTTALRCHEVLALLFSDDASANVASAEHLAVAAEAVGAAWVLTVFTTPLTSQAEKDLQRCATVFAEAGTGMAVEFSPLGPISSIKEGLEVVRAANRGEGRAGLMIDSWHFAFGDSTWEDLATVPLDEIAYLQFADALTPESDRLVRETLHRRALPGEGMLDLDRFATTLLERGWEGIVSVEVLSAELRALPVEALVRRLYETTAPYWH